MDATITLRKGCPPGDAVKIKTSTPALDPAAWLTRTEAAERLGVGPRTIDRYVRRDALSVYRGPVPGSGNGVRIWAGDVESFHYRHDVTVVEA
jgi:excisionase family DNA binding protein